ncbi:MAG TPA: DUF503 domain-containing protein [bacterium]|jgi:uncharacterized protein YlxP (DUF503 family)|nr:DUF503 domain-containing protein [bacterium]
MVIGLLRVEVHYPESGSLKTKRSTLKSVTDRLRKQFNVSVAEVEYQNLWQRSVLAVVTVNTDRPHADSTLSKVLDLMEREGNWQVTGVQTEYL